MCEAPSDPAWSKNQGMYGTFMCENREIPRPPIRVISGRDAQGTPRRSSWDERVWEVGRSRNTCEADEQGRRGDRGAGGGKGIDQGEHGQQNASRTQGRAGRAQCAGPCAAGGSTRQGGTVHRAVAPCDVDRLRDAYRAINPNAAPGVDEVTWAAYGQRTWRTTSVACTSGCMRGATGPGRPGGCTSRRRTGGYDRSASPRWRTRFFSGPSSRCSTRSTRRTSVASLTDFVLGVARTTRWTR